MYLSDILRECYRGQEEISVGLRGVVGRRAALVEKFLSWLTSGNRIMRMK